ncbi:MAG: phosphoribosylamine--glycine ligase [Alphaproteobacteria bacterium]|nr:phosphoribosylamine--glycine ligase [Alphaproteobacteria bacterium]
MKVLVIGAGGREHALCWAIGQSPQCEALFCAPGNAGIAGIATCLPVSAEDNAALVAAAKEHKIDLVVVGPEGPLVNGVADAMREAGFACFGPGKGAAEMEGSKGFMKDIVARAGVPTAAYGRFTEAEAARAYIRERGAPIVVKTDGLAAGKGVTVARTLDEALQAVTDAMEDKVFGDAGGELVIEEFMEGEEVSFFALCDGENAVPFASAQDHKAVFDGDKGPNTGGMGAYSPAPAMTRALQERVMAEMIMPTMRAMAAAGRPYCGVLFAGLMLTKSGPKLLEYNVRFGDPETQAMLPRLKSDLLQVLFAAATGKLGSVKLEWHDHAALCVVMAAEGYPGKYRKNTVIGGLENAGRVPGTVVFHAGTARNDAGAVVATGGRVLGVTATGPDIRAAQARAYEAVDRVQWPEGFCRRDIGWRAVGKAA